MSRDGTPGYRLYFRRGPFTLERIGSWDSPTYSLFGAWRTDRVVVFRFRGWLLLIQAAKEAERE